MKRGCFIVENAKVLMRGLKFPGYFYYMSTTIRKTNVKLPNTIG